MNEETNKAITIDKEAIKAAAKEKATGWWTNMDLGAKVNAAILLAILIVVILK